MIEKSIKRIYQRKIKEGKADADLVLANYEKLKEGLNDGLIGKIEKLEFGSATHRMYLNMRHNVFVTAVFKNYHNTEEMKAELFNPDGTVRTWAQFHKAAKPIAEVYNKNYLQAEWATAQASARMGSQWHKFVARGGKLMYETIEDARVRDEHTLLHGTVKPVNDVFWDKFYPPNGWRCRCHVRWLADDNADVEPTGLPDLKPMFGHNVGKSGEVFSKASPYFAIPAKDDKYAQKLFGMLPKMPADVIQVEKTIRLYNELIKDKDWILEVADKESGGFLFSHLLADISDLENNKEVGKILAKNGHSVQIRRHFKKGNPKNPELELDGKMADVKNPTKLTSINNGFALAAKQGIEMFVSYLTLDHTIEQLLVGIDKGFNYNPSIKEVLFVGKNKTITITRKNWVSGTYVEMVEKFMK